MPAYLNKQEDYILLFATGEKSATYQYLVIADTSTSVIFKQSSEYK
jgi:hypothetical protein